MSFAQLIRFFGYVLGELFVFDINQPFEWERPVCMS